MGKVTHRIESLEAADGTWFFHVQSRRGGKGVVAAAGYNSKAIANRQARAFLRGVRRPVEWGHSGRTV